MVLIELTAGELENPSNCNLALLLFQIRFQCREAETALICRNENVFIEVLTAELAETPPYEWLSRSGVSHRPIMQGHTPFGPSVWRVTGLGVWGHDAAASRRGRLPHVWPYTWTSPLGRLCRARRLAGSWISVERIQQETLGWGDFLFCWHLKAQCARSETSNMRNCATIGQ